MDSGLIASELKQAVVALLNEYPYAKRVLIAYSGGLDSHVLLHVCSTINHLKPKLHAVYVHHGLLAEADAWAEHCQQTAMNLGVPCQVIHVNAQAKSGESPEEAARNARYDALQAILNPDDLILLAQHQEDQMETVLLQLFRGAGLRGLSGMPSYSSFGLGFMLRPFLFISKQVLTDYAHAQSLCWVEDPSNSDNRFTRNFIRNQVTPILKQQWPQLDKTLARTARHCAEAEQLLVEQAEHLLSTIDSQNNHLSIPDLTALSLAKQKLVIRHWLQNFLAKSPSEQQLLQIIASLAQARLDSQPLMQIAGFLLRRYRDRLYCLPATPFHSYLPKRWHDVEQPLVISNQYSLITIAGSSGIAQSLWQEAIIDVRIRQGGEKIQLPYRKGSHSLKKLFQEAGIPVWEREIMPLIYLNGSLAAVGSLWVDARFFCQNNNCVQITMRYHSSG